MFPSHGNKDGKSIDPLMPKSKAPSTVRMGNVFNKESMGLAMEDMGVGMEQLVEIGE